jgi:hypothetical protein
MENLVLLIGVCLIGIGIRYQMLTTAEVKEEDKRDWFTRLWLGNRPKKSNLTETGLEYRRKSDWSSCIGFAIVLIYAFVLRQ